jgi:xanthine dehydrogenase accessory factor
MEAQVLQTLTECIQTNQPVALITIIANTGSSPGKTGAMMAVCSDGRINGTVGGGNLEYQAINEALGCITDGKSKEVRYSLNASSDLGMTCGGELRLFIKVFQPQPQLLVIGGGHIGLEVYKLGVHQGFRVIIVDDRPEMLTKERFPQAECILTEDLASTLTEYPVTASCYITIATRSHSSDRQALEAVVHSDAAYIGMIGSRNKIKNAMRSLLDHGVSRDKLEAVYAPMGLNIASVQPKEIAVSIISEILLVKNNGSLNHMRTVKNITF